MMPVLFWSKQTSVPDAQSNLGSLAELTKLDMEGSGSLDGSSEDAFGPLAAMLIGYQSSEFEQFRTCMHDMDADMVKVCLYDCCSFLLTSLLCGVAA